MATQRVLLGGLALVLPLVGAGQGIEREHLVGLVAEQHQVAGHHRGLADRPLAGVAPALLPAEGVEADQDAIGGADVQQAARHRRRRVDRAEALAPARLAVAGAQRDELAAGAAEVDRVGPGRGRELLRADLLPTIRADPLPAVGQEIEAEWLGPHRGHRVDGDASAATTGRAGQQQRPGQRSGRGPAPRRRATTLRQRDASSWASRASMASLRSAGRSPSASSACSNEVMASAARPSRCSTRASWYRA